MKKTMIIALLAILFAGCSQPKVKGILKEKVHLIRPDHEFFLFIVETENGREVSCNVVKQTYDSFEIGDSLCEKGKFISYTNR